MDWSLTWSNTLTARRILTLTTGLLAGLAWSVFGQADAPETINEEDVVRMFVQGMDEDTLIGQIETLPGQYDLSDEMLDELRIAGIPETVLQAMLRRQAELHPAIEEIEVGTANGLPRLIVRLNPDWKPGDDKSRPVLRALDSIDSDLAQTLGLRSVEDPITDISIALFCRTSDHVPDHWRSKTPLGRDFGAVPRHRMLAFHSGAQSKPASKLRNSLTKLIMAPGARESIADLNVLSLEVPDHLDIEVTAGVAHDLTLGIALRIGERNYLTLSAERSGVVVADSGETRVAAILRGGTKNPLKARVEFLEPEPEQEPH
jgi:hypothetical protein